MKTVRFMTGWAVQEYKFLMGWIYVREGSTVKMFDTEEQAEKFIHAERSKTPIWVDSF